MEKLIYIHIISLGESFKGFMDSGYKDATNDWYVIEQKSNGAEMTRAFEDAGQLNNLGLGLLDTDCEVIGSCIYVIGGRCLLCEADPECEYKGSAKILYLDTRDPKHFWRTCFCLPFTLSGGKSAVVDNQWLYIFAGDRHSGCLPPNPWGYAVNVDESKVVEERVREIAQPGNAVYPPVFATCLSPGTLVAYTETKGTLYHLDCKNNSWSVYQKELPYNPTELIGCSMVFDGILYIYDSHNMQLSSYDIRNKKELHVVDLPRSFWFGLDDAIELIVLSKGRFCIIQDAHGNDANELHIYYTRFSVSYHPPKPTVHIEEQRSFRVRGCRLLNVVAIDPHSDVANGSHSSRSN